MTTGAWIVLGLMWLLTIVAFLGRIFLGGDDPWGPL